MNCKRCGKQSNYFVNDLCYACYEAAFPKPFQLHIDLASAGYAQAIANGEIIAQLKAINDKLAAIEKALS